jgi:hypothetical protein
MVNQGNRLEEEVFEFVRESEEAVLGKVADAVGEFLPFEVPVVSELVEGILEVTAAVMKTQREFAQRMLEQTRNAVGMTTRTKPRATASARRATATRASKGPQVARTTRPAKRSVKAA